MLILHMDAQICKRQLLNSLKQYFDQTSNIKTIRSHLHRLKDEGRLNFDRAKNEWSLP